MIGLVDRLVCGELDETARRHLLAWLEADPIRWRLCGVAFLEAQTWSAAIGGWSRAEDMTVVPPNASECPSAPRLAEPVSQCPPMRGPTHFRRASIAAALVVAFGLGLVVRGIHFSAQQVADLAASRNAAPTAANVNVSAGPAKLPAKQMPVLASLTVETDDTGGKTPIHFTVLPAATGKGQAGEPAEIPDYVRQKWERRGYKVSLERRFVFAKLADGQKVVVPIEQVQVNPLPIHVN